MKQKNTVIDVLQHYLLVLEQIDQGKRELATLADEAAEIPGVERRPFKSLAKAIHEAPGTTEAKLESLEDFIKMAFKPQNEAFGQTTFNINVE